MSLSDKQAFHTNAPEILVVEDEQTVRETVCDMLVRLGYKVVSCEDGEEALELTRSRSFDLLLTDIELPRLNGKELIEQLRASGREIKPLLMTGHRVVAMAPEQPFLLKPFDMRTLGRAVSELLHEA